MTNANAPTAKRKVRAAKRKAEALRYRIGGMTFEAIGKQLGVSTQAAYKLVKSALAAIQGKTTESALELRGLELARLEAAQVALWPKVVGFVRRDKEGREIERVDGGQEQAITALLRIMERRSKLLGLDAPARSELSGAGGGPLQTQAVPPDMEALRRMVEEKKTELARLEMERESLDVTEKQGE